MFSLFLKGLLIGFAIAAPVGPIGILCIQRSLHEGFKIGLMTGLGAALADGVYGFIAGFGLTAISDYLIAHQVWIRAIGGLFLIYLGIKLFLTGPIKKNTPDKVERSPIHAFNTTFLLTLTNPTTILAFIAVFAGLGIGTVNKDFISSLLLISGILAGSATWWLFLSSGIAFVLHHRLSNNVIQSINRISGTVIFIFGIVALITLFIPLQVPSK